MDELKGRRNEVADLLADLAVWIARGPNMMEGNEDSLQKLSRISYLEGEE